MSKNITLPEIPDDLKTYHQEENKENCLFFADKNRNVHLSYGDKIVEFSFSIPKKKKHEQGFVFKDDIDILQIVSKFMNQKIESIENLNGMKKTKYNQFKKQ